MAWGMGSHSTNAVLGWILRRERYSFAEGEVSVHWIYEEFCTYL